MQRSFEKNQEMNLALGRLEGYELYPSLPNCLIKDRALYSFSQVCRYDTDVNFIQRIIDKMTKDQVMTYESLLRRKRMFITQATIEERFVAVCRALEIK